MMKMYSTKERQLLIESSLFQAVVLKRGRSKNSDAL